MFAKLWAHSVKLDSHIAAVATIDYLGDMST